MLLSGLVLIAGISAVGARSGSRGSYGNNGNQVSGIWSKGGEPGASPTLDPEWDKVGEKELEGIIKGLGSIDTPAEFAALFCAAAVVVGGLWYVTCSSRPIAAPL